jgi:hypothetical protein
MIIGKNLARGWAVLSLISIAIDIACYVLAQTSPVPLPNRPGINYEMIFLASAPAPFVLAFLAAALGSIAALLRWLARLLRRPRRQHPRRAPTPPRLGVSAP